MLQYNYNTSLLIILDIVNIRSSYMDINLELYKVFYYVVRAGSVTKASQELYISQPAVSQSIRQLETKIGGQLFIRTPKGITLTPEGEVLYKYIEQGYNMILLAESKFSEAINLDAGEIRIGASDMTLKYFLLPHLEEFHKHYPKVRIKVTNGPSPETVACLKNGLIDFGIVSLPLFDDSATDVIEAMEIQDCFIANYKFGHLASNNISLKELLNYPVIMLEKNTSTRRYIDHFLYSYGITIIPEIELATSDLLVQFARRGLGISCVVKNFAENDLENGSIFELDLIEKIPPRQIGIIKLKNTPLSAAAVRFTELINSKA
jgi:DNA-binding transcriptional LysR family regulator